MSKKLQLGDKVTWQSQAGGNKLVKEGVIAGVLEAGLSASLSGVIRDTAEQYGAIPRNGSGDSRNHESYLVLVKQPGNRKPRLYWPRVDYLIKIGRNVRALKGR